MNSPVENRKPMERVTLEEGLLAYRCVESGGVFIPADAYWRWLHKQPARLPQLPAPSDEPLVVQDSDQVLICPETGMFMIRCRVGHGFEFSIDRSPSGSIWLDAGEWEALKARQFHDELHLVFTSPWQSQLRHQARDQAEDARLVDRLGADLTERLKGLRDELADHPDRMFAISFLERETR